MDVLNLLTGNAYVITAEGLQALNVLIVVLGASLMLNVVFAISMIGVAAYKFFHRD